MIFDRDTTEPVALFTLTDDTYAFVPNILFDDTQLSVQVLRPGDVTFSSLSLVAGTAGTYIPDSWVYVSRGVYQLCLDPQWVVPGQYAIVDVQYVGCPLLRMTMEFTGSPSLSVTQEETLGKTLKEGGTYTFVNVETAQDSTIRFDPLPEPQV